MSIWTILCDIFCLCILCLFVWSFDLNVHNKNKNPKKTFCVDCWFDLRPLDLELGNSPYAKDLANANFHETKCLWSEHSSDTKVKTHLSSSATWSLWAVILNLWLVEFICYTGQFVEDYGVSKAWMWLSLFDALALQDWYNCAFVCCLILNVQGNSGFLLTFLSIGLLPIGQIFSTLNF